jgi:hypothetical protein
MTCIFCCKAKIYEEPYKSKVEPIKNEILKKCDDLNDNHPLDVEYLKLLLELISEIDKNSTMRSSKRLIKKRIETEASQNRLEILQLAFETAEFCEMAVLYCNSTNKLKFHDCSLKLRFKQFYKPKKSCLDETDRVFLQYLYKIPALMLLKRGIL